MGAILPNVYQVAGVREGETLPSFSSVGGYTIIYYSKRGEPFCGGCATKHEDEHDPIMHAGTYDEGPTLECSECGTDIESSYGDPNSDDERYDHE